MDFYTQINLQLLHPSHKRTLVGACIAPQCTRQRASDTKHPEGKDLSPDPFLGISLAKNVKVLNFPALVFCNRQKLLPLYFSELINRINPLFFGLFM